MYKYDYEKYVKLLKEVRDMMYEEIKSVDKINPNNMNPETKERNLMINNFYDLDYALENTEKRTAYTEKQIKKDLNN